MLPRMQLFLTQIILSVFVKVIHHVYVHFGVLQIVSTHFYGEPCTSKRSPFPSQSLVKKSHRCVGTETGINGMLETIVGLMTDSQADMTNSKHFSNS